MSKKMSLTKQKKIALAQNYHNLDENEKKRRHEEVKQLDEWLEKDKQRNHERHIQSDKLLTGVHKYNKKYDYEYKKLHELSYKEKEAVAAGILTYKNGKLHQGPNAHIPHRWDRYQDTFVPVLDPYRKNQKSKLEYQRKENERVRHKQIWARDIARHPYKDIIAYIFDPDVKEHKRKKR